MTIKLRLVRLEGRELPPQTSTAGAREEFARRLAVIRERVGAGHFSTEPSLAEIMAGAPCSSARLAQFWGYMRAHKSFASIYDE